MFDTHCHLTFPDFAGRVDSVLNDTRKAGVRGAITISTTSANCLESRALAQRFENLWFSAGVHPLYADQPVDWNEIVAAGADPKCVAWGELGLDNHYDDPPRAQQDRVLSDQLAFIESQHREGHIKPIVLHCREAYDELIAILATTAFERSRFVFHCFTGTPDDARAILDFGAWISFTGIVTFRNAPQVAEAAKLVPADRIMVETDAPFLSPEPARKVRPNEPKHVVHVARFLAQLRGADEREFEQQLDANAQRFFGISF